MKLLKVLVIASLLTIASIETWHRIAPSPPRHPHLARLSRMGQRIARRIKLPIAAHAIRDELPRRW
jgi:hypothetical protein